MTPKQSSVAMGAVMGAIVAAGACGIVYVVTGGGDRGSVTLTFPIQDDPNRAETIVTRMQLGDVATSSGTTEAMIVTLTSFVGGLPASEPVAVDDIWLTDTFGNTYRRIEGRATMLGQGMSDHINAGNGASVQVPFEAPNPEASVLTSHVVVDGRPTLRLHTRPEWSR